MAHERHGYMLTPLPDQKTGQQAESTIICPQHEARLLALKDPV
jgi:hypothetical protein